jgi:Protein of unknown function (DUF1569)
MTSLADTATRQSVLKRIARLEPGTKPRWGRMSAHQMLCHLTDSFLAAIGEKQVSPATGLVQRTLMKWGALYSPIPWPKGLATRPEVEQGVGGTPPVDFELDRAGLISVVERFAEPGRAFSGHRHPVLGELRDSQWLRWGYLHTDHHLRQFGV